MGWEYFKYPLTEEQIKVLLHGPNFAVVSTCPPVGEYIAAIEQACTQLKQGEVEELRGEVKIILEKIQPPKSNIMREEQKALAELRTDKKRIILTADKGVPMVVMDREDYIKKAEGLLGQPAYKPIPTDPTTKYKNNSISLLKTIKTEGGINDVIYRKALPHRGRFPQVYGLPKVQKEGMPLRPIVYSIGAVTYEASKDLSRILKPLGRKLPYQVQNNKEFIQHLEGIQLSSDEIIVSYDVKALFTSVPIQPALNIIKKFLKDNTELHQRTSVTLKHITCLLEFCMKSTYFTFQDKYYKQWKELSWALQSAP